VADEFADLPGLGAFGEALVERARRADPVELPAVDDFGRALVTRVRQRERRRGRLRRIVLTVAVALPVAATSGAATAVVLREAVISPPDPAQVPDEQTPLAGTARVSPVRAADPGGGLPWALRVARGKTGFTCTTVGQVRDGVFGLTGLDGVFRRLPGELSDACGQGGTLTGARVVAADKASDVRSIVYGVAGDDLRAATLQTATGDRKLRIGRDGTFVAALRGYPEDSAAGVALTFAGGRAERHNFGAATDTIPDPDGGQAWSIQRLTLGTRLQCANVRTARAPSVGGSSGPNGSATITPTACLGLRTSKRAWAADARSFHPGDRGAEGFDRWDWRDHPARTVVWGVGRDGKALRSVKLKGAGAPRELALSKQGAFAAVLPRERRSEGALARGRVGRRDRRARPSGRGPDRRPHPLPEAAMIARLALLAALGGSAIGATVVLGDDRGAAPAVPVVAPPKVSPEPSQPPVDATNVRILLRQDDPGGGAPWAVRHFDAKAPGGQSVECFELGRLGGDRFGWVDGSGTFAIAPAGHFLLQSACQPARQRRELGASAMRFTTLALPAGGTPQPLETISWGVAAQTVRALLPKGEPAIVPGEHGLFLQILEGEGSRLPLTGELEYRDGHRVAFNRMPEPRPEGETPVPGTDYVAARAPDPAGGEPWGLLASRGSSGDICVSMTGRLVGTRLGNVDRRLGIFYSGPFDALQRCGDAVRKPTRAFPMRLDTGVWGDRRRRPARPDRAPGAQRPHPLPGPRPPGRGQRHDPHPTRRAHPDPVEPGTRDPRGLRRPLPRRQGDRDRADEGRPGGDADALLRMRT
jgi:hypothetical protein